MKLASTVCLLFALAAPAVSQAPSRILLEGYLWEPDPSGSVQVVRSGLGTDIDLVGDLGLQTEALTGLRASFRPSRNTRLQVGALPISFSGDKVVTQSITFGGQTFSISERVTSAVELDYLSAAFAWQFFASDDGRFRAGPVVAVKAFDGSASLAAPDLSSAARVSETFEAAFGAAGIAIDLEPTERFHIYGEYTALVEGDEGDQTDLEVGIRVPLWGPLMVTGGVRSVSVRFNDGDDSVDFDLDAAFFGAALRF